LQEESTKMCCSVLLFVAVRYGVLQCFAVCCSADEVERREPPWQEEFSRCIAVCRRLLQCVAV